MDITCGMALNGEWPEMLGQFREGHARGSSAHLGPPRRCHQSDDFWHIFLGHEQFWRSECGGASVEFVWGSTAYVARAFQRGYELCDDVFIYMGGALQLLVCPCRLES